VSLAVIRGGAIAERIALGPSTQTMTNGEGGKPPILALLATLFKGQHPFRPGD